MTQSVFKGRRVLCIAKTPFQVLGLLCIFGNSDNRDYACCDLVVVRMFGDADEYADRVRDEGLFDHVFCCDMKYEVGESHLGIKYLVDGIFRNARSRSRYFDMFPELRGLEYDCVLSSSIGRLNMDAKRYSVPHGVTIFYDDGSGSHNGAVFKQFSFFDDGVSVKGVSRSAKERVKDGARKLACRFLSDSAKFNTESIWLFAPTPAERDMYDGAEVVEIGRPDDPSLIVRAMTDGGLSGDYGDKRFIYLSLPGSLPKATLEDERLLVSRLVEMCGGALYVRPHPRRDPSDFPMLAADHVLSPHDPWEVLLLTGAINESSVLIAHGSSAQIHPKTLAGIEPTLVFTYGIVSQEGLSVSSLDDTVKKMRELYENKDRILVPRTFDELGTMLVSLGG